MSAAIELLGVGKEYEGWPPVVALRDVDLVIGEGELVALVGPSGSGKSTMLHLMGTLDRPTTGTVRVAGPDVAAMNDSQLSRLRANAIGFVFQQFFLLGGESALENVADGLLYRGVDGVARREAAHQALQRVGLGHRVRHRPAQLSGGERQRVAIARALVGRPMVILADEPTGNLDSATGGELLELLLELNAEDHATIVVITHDWDLASRLPRQVEIRDGRIDGDPARVQPTGRSKLDIGLQSRSETPAATVGTH